MDEREDAAALRAFLESRDAPCPRCGYNLRGLTAGACPECKHVPRLQLERVDRPSGRMYVFVVTLGIVGALRGGWSAFETIYDYFNFRQLQPSVVFNLTLVIWAIMYVCLTTVCVFGLARVVTQRGTDGLGAATERFVFRLLTYVLVSYALALAMGVGRMLGLT